MLNPYQNYSDQHEKNAKYTEMMKKALTVVKSKFGGAGTITGTSPFTVTLGKTENKTIQNMIKWCYNIMDTKIR